MASFSGSFMGISLGVDTTNQSELNQQDNAAALSMNEVTAQAAEEIAAQQQQTIKTLGLAGAGLIGGIVLFKTLW